MKARTQQKSKRGRPEKEINPKVFEGLCRIQCTQQEVIAVLEVSRPTLHRWCKRTYGMNFEQVFEQKSAMGKISLRRSQFKMAESKPVMAIWLGKQYLGQKDKHEVEVSDKRQVVLSAIEQHRKDYPEISEDKRLEWFAQDSGIDKAELVSEANN